MARAIFTLTPRSNVRKDNHIINVKKVIHVEMDSDMEAEFYNTHTEEVESIKPINISVFKHDVIIRGERHGIIHMLTKG